MKREEIKRERRQMKIDRKIHTRTLTLTTVLNWCFVKGAPSMSLAE